MVHDLLTAEDERNNLAIERTPGGKTDRLGRRGTWIPRTITDGKGRTIYRNRIWWNPDWAGASEAPSNTPLLVLGHELLHAWQGMWINKEGVWDWRVSRKEQTATFAKMGAVELPMSEVWGVRAENQVGREIYGEYEPRTTYTKSGQQFPIGDHSAAQFGKCPDAECTKWFDDLKKNGW